MGGDGPRTNTGPVGAITSGIAVCGEEVGGGACRYCVCTGGRGIPPLGVWGLGNRCLIA